MILDSNFIKSGSFLGMEGHFLYATLAKVSSGEEIVKSKSALVIQEYFADQGKCFTFSEWKTLTIKQAYQQLYQERVRLSYEGGARIVWEDPQIKPFREQFDFIANQINSAKCVKSVPIALSYANTTVNEGQLTHLILKAVSATLMNPNLIAYGYWIDGQGVIGVTPEILLMREKDEYKTAALAGTRPLAASNGRLPLIEDSKERREHQIVINSILTVLQSIATVEVGETKVITLPTLEHLKTEIKFKEIKSMSFLDLVALLHPTAALGPFPRSKMAMEELKELPNQKRRRFFGGPITFKINARIQATLVMIRNIQWDRNGQYIFAGVGQIYESEIQREWIEACEKIRMVKKLLL